MGITQTHKQTKENTMSAFETLIERAEMRYPHFELDPGPAEIEAAKNEHTQIVDALKAVKTQLAHLYHNGQIKANAPERDRIMLCILNAEYALEKAGAE
jgi:hypothetical protein